MNAETNDLIEKLSEKVHDAWLEEKKKQGFHAPIVCESDERKSYMKSYYKQKTDFIVQDFSPESYKWCKKCHVDMYPYGELPENIKEYDRVTVRTVLQALDFLGKKVI